MTKCDYCGTTILFSVVDTNGYRFCNQTCQRKRYSLSAINQTGQKKAVRERDKYWLNTSDDRPELPPEPKPSDDSSVDDLIAYLGCVNNPEFRHHAADLLGRMGSTAAPATSALLKSCVDVNATVRKAALNALESIDPEWFNNTEIRNAFPNLVAALKNSSEDVSKAAFRLLQRIGRLAIPDLVKILLKEEDKIKDKVCAIQILGEIGSDAASAVPELIQALSSKASKVRIAAADALVKCSKASDAEATVPKLVVGLVDRDVDVRKAMATCLIRFGTAAKSAVPDLLPLLAERDPKVRETVVDALGQIGPPTVPMLNDMLINIISQRYSKLKADINLEKYLNTWDALSGLEKQASLEIALEAALQVLRKLGPDASVSVPTIALALADPNPNIKLAAVQALGNINHNWVSDPVVTDAIPDLVKQLSKVEKSGEVAVRLFTAIGTAAVPVLIDALESGERVTRQNAARTLGRIGTGAKAAIPALTKAASEDNHLLVRDEAAEALAKINDPG